MSRTAKALVDVSVMTGKNRVRIEKKEIVLHVIATGQGYAMVRRKGAVPFVLEETRLNYDY